jgi:hypothetical protein
MKNLVTAASILGFWIMTIFIVTIAVLLVVNRVNHDHGSHDHAPTVDFQVTAESTTPGEYIHPNNGGSYYRITLNAPITLTGNPVSGEIECSNKYGSITVVMAYKGIRGIHSQPVHGSRTILYNGLPDITSTLEINDTLDRCNGVGTWRRVGFN